MAKANSSSTSKGKKKPIKIADLLNQKTVSTNKVLQVLYNTCDHHEIQDWGDRYKYDKLTFFMYPSDFRVIYLSGTDHGKKLTAFEIDNKKVSKKEVLKQIDLIL